MMKISFPFSRRNGKSKNRVINEPEILQNSRENKLSSGKFSLFAIGMYVVKNRPFSSIFRKVRNCLELMNQNKNHSRLTIT